MLRFELMFNILNTRTQRGKQAAMLCKILNRLSKLSPALCARLAHSLYVIEGSGLSKAIFAPVGLRIALSAHQPALIRVRTGKD